MKKKVYIISPSHWDREWYMAYEQHHMRAIELVDDILALIKTDPDFNSFHLDGQTIILDDYLQVRPEKREELQQAVTSGKLQIGPFYILQDDFLISSESNVRNMLIGMEESKKWGTPVMLGYFPDTFGNMGQTPQMMRQAGLSAAAFGRGVKPIGFDNEVIEAESYSSQYSEMNWQGPDGSEIFGLLFANWYSNGNEIPSDKEAAIAFWKQKLADVERFAATDHLLMMNGVDHQPVQKDITKAIRLANELFPEYEFVHSNFGEYLEAVQGDLPKEIDTVSGELTSQETDGWYTLANTASARVYLKQWNTKVQRQLENIAEPLAAMACEITGEYPHDQLDYAWKTLLQNHPHDSICGCSVDEVHRGMIPRFETAYEVGKYIEQEALSKLAQAIDTTAFPKDSLPFTVFNTNGAAKTGEVSVDVELERRRFSEGVPDQLFEELERLPKESYTIINQLGETILGNLSEVKVRYGYDLPKDAFRVPYMARYITVTLALEEMSGFSWETYALVKGPLLTEEGSMVHHANCLENSRIKIDIAMDGSLAVTDKLLDCTYENLLIFEDIGDIGNEYIFKQPEGTKAILTKGIDAKTEVTLDEPEKAQVKIIHNMVLPISADGLLRQEQERVVEFRQRKAQRSKQTAVLEVETLLTIRKNSGKLDIETTVNNQMKDHRLRVLFPTNIKTATHEADSIFEVVRRSNTVSDSWENPTNPQHQHAFVNLHDETKGLTVGNYGLNEYEIVDGQIIALTLLRSVGEMGDWGYFPTPEAQCLGEHHFSYSIEFHGQPEERYQTYKNAGSAQVPFSAVQVSRQSGQLPPAKQYLEVDSDAFAVTALKRGKESNQLVLRGFNMLDQTAALSLSKDGELPAVLNLLEEPTAEEFSGTLRPYEIRTVGFKKL